MQSEDDVVMAALEKVKDWAMEKMLGGKSEDAHEQEETMSEESAEHQEGPSVEIELETGGEEEPMDEPMDEEEPMEPAPTVLGKYDFVGAPLKKKPSKVPVSRR